MVRHKFATASGFLAIAALMFNVHSSLAAASGTLEVQFNGLKNSKGQVCLNLFSSAKGFPGDAQSSNAKASRCVTLSKGNTITLTNLPYGNYAISVMHDSNNDGRLNRNFFGVPSEGIGFSNNPPIRTGPASYTQSQFLLSKPKTVLQIQMRYF